MNKLDAYWDFLIDNGIVSEDALRLVTNINGYSEDTLDDVLYCQTGNRSVEQYCDENEIELPDFVEESTNISSLTNKILEGADVKDVLSKVSITEKPQMYLKQRTIEVVLPNEEPFYITLSVPGNMKNPKGYISNWIKSHLPSNADWDYNESKKTFGCGIKE